MLTAPRKAAFAIVCLVALTLVHASAAAPPAAPHAPAAPQAMPTLPSAASILAMVRNTLLAVDQADKTGNYTVLRDLGGPDFRNANDAARLAQIFAPLRSQGIDMLTVAVVDPLYREPPRMTVKRMLYVSGQLPIVPRRVNFELLFEVVTGQWRVYGVSIVPA